MKKFKKSIAFLLSVFLLLTNGMMSAEETRETETVSVKQHEHALNVLGALGVLTEEEVADFRETSNVTRAEFVYYMLRLMGYPLDLTVSRDAVRFSDIPYTYWAAPYIVYASDMGLISGYENGEFGAEDWVTYEQAIKITLSVIGHTKENSRLTDYPVSYITLASQLGLLEGVKGVSGTPITGGDVAELLFNTLETEAVQQRSFGSKEYYAKDGALMMEYYLKVEKIKGVWNADENKNIYGGNFPMKGCIEIDRMPYYLGDCVPDSSLLFKNVVAYVRMEEDEDEYSTLLFLEQGKGDYLEIPTDELTGTPSISSLRYYEGNNASNASLADNLTVLLNGRYYKPKNSVTESDLSQPQTTLMLYDNDRDGEYEILQLRKAEIVAVDKVSSNYGLIYFKYDTMLDGKDYIDASNIDHDSVVNIYRKDGERAELSTLKQWDILEIYRTVDSSYTEIYVSEERVRGVIESISEDELVINSETYLLSQQYTDAVNAGNASVFIPKIGAECNFYLSANGRIGAISAGSAGDYLYAYMIAVDGDPSDLSPVARVKLFSQTGEMLELEVANKVTLDGKSYTDHAKFLENIFAGTYSRQCIVKYGTNAEGKLNYLDTPERTAQDASNPNSVRFEMTYDGDMNWTAGYELDGTLMRMTSQTVIFSIPDDLSKDKDFRCIKNSQLPIDTDRDVSVKFDLYDANDVYRVGAAVYYADSATADQSRYTGTLVVDRIVKIYDEEEDARTKIYGYQAISLSAGAGYTVSATFLEEEPGIFDGVVPGSVIHYKVNSKNEIKEIRHDFKPDPGLSYYGTREDVQFGDRYYGEIIKISQADKMILIDAGAAGNISFLTRGIVRYDAKRRKVRQIAFEDMSVGDKVYLVGNNSHPMITVIYNYE